MKERKSGVVPFGDCNLSRGVRPCECDLPRCPKCGYTQHDARFEMDHALCEHNGGRIPHDGDCEMSPISSHDPRNTVSPVHRWIEACRLGCGCMAGQVRGPIF